MDPPSDSSIRRADLREGRAADPGIDPPAPAAEAVPRTSPPGDKALTVTYASPGAPEHVPADAAGSTLPQERPSRAALAGAVQVPGYVIEGELGRGGMGIVYKARHLALKRTVALKMILGGSHANADALARFRAEAEAAARLQHANIVQVYEIGEHAGLPFLSLEFVDGGSLRARAAGTPQPPREAARLAAALAEAVHFAHQHGIVHRDLKPANILLAGAPRAAVPGSGPAPLGDCVPKVTDFGLAKLLDADDGQTRTGQVMGTPSYMAPEQAAGKVHQVGPAADVYALGAVLYELLIGRPPFKAETALDTLAQVMHDDPVPPRRLLPKTPRDLETICLKCLQKEPGKRYASAAALADDLGRFLAGEPIRARPARAWELAIKWTRRNPRRAAGLAALLLLALLGAAFAAWDRTKTAAHNEELQKEIGLKEAAGRAADANARLANANAKLAEERRLEEAARSVRLTVAAGDRFQEEGDPFTAMLFHAQAFGMEDRDSPREGPHRLRLTTALRQFPTLVGVWAAHQGAVTHVEFSPDGRRFLAAGQDGTARVWDAGTGEAVGPVLRHDKAINRAAFSPDGRYVVTGSDDATAVVWDAATGDKILGPLKSKRPVLHVAFSQPDGRYVLAVSGTRFGRTINTTQQLPGQMRYVPSGVGPNGVPIMIPITTPGTTITTPQTPRGLVEVWDLAAQKQVCLLAAPGWLNYAAFSPDGRRVATAGGSEEGRSYAQIWSVPEGKRINEPLRHAGQVHQAVFSPDGLRVVTASGRPDGRDGEALLWDAAEGKAVGRPMRHDGPVTQAWFSPDGRRVLTASDDQTARVWDADTGDPLTPPVQHAARLVGAWFSPDGRLILTACEDGAARVWDADTGELIPPLLRHGAPLTCAAFSPEGRRILTADREGAVRLWDLAGARRSALLQHYGLVPPRARITETITLADAMHTMRTRSRLGDLVVSSVLFSPSGDRIFTACGDHVVDVVPFGGQTNAATDVETTHVCLWDSAAARTEGAPLPQSVPLTAASVSPDGRRVATVHDTEVLIREIPSGNVLIRRALERPAGLSWGVGGPHLCAAFGPDGRCSYAVAVPMKAAKPGDAPPSWEVQVRDVETNELRVPPLEHPTQLEYVAFSADGTKLATVMLQTAVVGQGKPRLEWVTRVWDLANEGRPLGAPLTRDGAVTEVAVSPDGRYAVAYAPRRSAIAWVAARGVEEEPETTAYLWALGRDGPPAPLLLKHAGTVTHVAFSPDSRLVCTCSADHTARAWRTADGVPATPPLEHRSRVNFAAFRDAGLLATAGDDDVVRLWDAATGQPAGAPLRHQDAVLCVAFDRLGRRLVAGCGDGAARVWDLAPDERPAEAFGRLGRLLAGRRIDDTGGLTALDPAALERLWKELRADAPRDFTPSQEEILAWHEQEAEECERLGRWSAALPHLEQLTALRPQDPSLCVRRGRADAGLGRWREAERDFVRAVDLGANDDPVWRVCALAQLEQGDRDAYRRTCARLADHAGKGPDRPAAGMPLRIFFLAPEALPDLGAVVLQAQAAADAKGPDHAAALGALGAALYRAGQAGAAVQRLNEAVKVRGGQGDAWDCLFLAMAHQRLDEPSDAQAWLQKAIPQIPQAAKGKVGAASPSWMELLELDVLRREVEALLEGATDESRK